MSSSSSSESTDAHSAETLPLYEVMYAWLPESDSDLKLEVGDVVEVGGLLREQLLLVHTGYYIACIYIAYIYIYDGDDDSLDYEYYY